MGTGLQPAAGYDSESGRPSAVPLGGEVRYR